jgi:N-acetyl-gamma-glutamyl-phosphate reductase
MMDKKKTCIIIQNFAYLCKYEISHREAEVIRTAIIGASGYSGAELLRLLSRRSDVRVEKVTARSSAGERVDKLYPALTGVVDLSYQEFDPAAFTGIDVAFVALPSGEAMHVVPALRGIVPRIIDLGGDFRLRSPQSYERYYRRKHASPELLPEAVYGLPEIHAEKIARAQIVANPGCYPTAAILALLPALKHGIVHPRGIVINALSGVSGAGRSAAVEYSFVEVNENIRAYKVGVHQHTPEIVSVLESATAGEVSLSFVPHLVPITRGIYATIHAELAVSVTDDEIAQLYSAFYEHAPFVRIKRQIPEIRNVVYTNYCDITAVVAPGTRQLILISVIDNLVKGAAGQAVQNMNLMMGLPQETSLA